MGNQSSRPGPDQDVSKNEPNQPSSTVASTSSESASRHLTPAGQSYNPLGREFFVNSLALIDMDNQSSRPGPDQEVSKNEPNQQSSTVASTSSESASLHLTALTPSRLNYNPLGQEVFVNRVALYAAENAQDFFQLKSINTIWEDAIRNIRNNALKNSVLKNNPKFGFTKENLLLAVTMGMESKNVNLDRKPKDVFAADILALFPEILLERSDITDWGGRAFKNITAFEYALWAKDFKMIEMMLKYIPKTEDGDRIRAGLLEQYKQVKAPVHAGGGLTYELTYDRPTQDEIGIPIKDAAGNWQTTPVTEVHTENHFDMTPLIDGYEDCENNFYARNAHQRDACWTKIIGTLQRLLPIHILQRYCDPDNPFGTSPSFTGDFKRTTNFLNELNDQVESLLSSELSNKLSLFRGDIVFGAYEARGGDPQSLGAIVFRHASRFDLAAVRELDEFSAREIRTKIKPLLTGAAPSPTHSRPYIRNAKCLLERFTEFRDLDDDKFLSKSEDRHLLRFFLGLARKHAIRALSHNHDHAQKKCSGPELLSLVIKGQQDAVVEMLTQDPGLLLYRGNVVDYSGREFKNVTALELVTWALDVRHMARAILKCLIENDKGKDYIEALGPDLQRQFESVVKDGGGVTYTIGCGLLKMSQDPRALLPDRTEEERHAELNRKLNRHDGLIQHDDKLFYFHNLKSPKKLVQITNPANVRALQGLINQKERALTVDTLQIINNDDELQMIEKNVPDSRHIFHEKHYDFTPFLSALDVYIHSLKDDTTLTWDAHARRCPVKRKQRDAYLCAVIGLAQYYAPAHVAQHYCNPDESFQPRLFHLQRAETPPTFKEKIFKRALNFINITSRKTEHWWSSLGETDSSVLGLEVGIIRGSEPAQGYGIDPAPYSFHDPLKFLLLCEPDLAALTTLCEVRNKSDLTELKQLLDSFQKPDADPEPARRLAQ